MIEYHSGSRHLSAPMRDLLLAHIDGSATVPVEFNAKNAACIKSTWAAIAHGLIRPDGLPRMKQTFITDKGREVLAMALADWADALVRAGYDGNGGELVPASLRWQPRSTAS